MCIVAIMLKFEVIANKAYLDYELQHQEMKHLLDLCKNGRGHELDWVVK